jgi:hypothetical protein
VQSARNPEVINNSQELQNQVLRIAEGCCRHMARRVARANKKHIEYYC